MSVFACLSVSRSVCQSLCLSMSQSLCLYVSLSVCLSVCLSVYESVSLSVCLSLCLQSASKARVTHTDLEPASSTTFSWVARNCRSNGISGWPDSWGRKTRVSQPISRGRGGEGHTSFSRSAQLTVKSQWLTVFKASLERNVSRCARQTTAHTRSRVQACCGRTYLYISKRCNMKLLTASADWCFERNIWPLPRLTKVCLSFPNKGPPHWVSVPHR